MALAALTLTLALTMTLTLSTLTLAALALAGYWNPGVVDAALKSTARFRQNWHWQNWY